MSLPLMPLDLCWSPFFSLNDYDILDLFTDNEVLPFDNYCDMLLDPFDSIDRYCGDYSPDNLLNEQQINLLRQSLYRDLDECNLFVESCLSIVSLNIRSVPRNLHDEFLLDFSHHIVNIDVFAFCETRLSSDLCDLYAVPEFKLFSNPRNTSGGGVALYVRNKYRATMIQNMCLMCPSIETVVVQFIHFERVYMVINIYRPPGSDFDIFHEKLLELLDFTVSAQPTASVIFLGDFNLNLFSKSKITKLLNSTMFSFGYMPVVLRPTRVTSHSATLIDHIWSNAVHDVSSSGIIRYSATDHFPTYVQVRCGKKNNSDECFMTVTRRRRGSECDELFSSHLAQVCWTDLLEQMDVDVLYDEFISGISHVYDLCYPLETKKAKILDIEKPHITPDIKLLIKKRHKLLKLSHKWPLRYRESYCKLRNFVNKKIRAAKSLYYQTRLDDISQNPKKSWSVINDVLGRCSPQLHSAEFCIGDQTIRDPIVIAAKFNEYFAAVGENLATNFTGPSNYLQYINCEINELFELHPVTETEVEDIVMSLRDAAPGVDGLPISLFRSNFALLGKIITHICNVGIRGGTFPQKFMIARVSCIFKSGDAKSISNYRPISVLPCFSKIIENIIARQLITHFSDYNLFTDSQFGFLPKLSTQNAVLRVTDILFDAFNTGEIALGVFLDLSKAFDSLNRTILFDKLKKYGVQGNSLNWFRSYFSRRMQCVIFEGHESPMLTVDYGVPQGSVIGPILFLIFINDIVNASNKLKFIMYADDTNVVLSNRNLNDGIDLLNRELILVSDWFVNNCLTLNASKSQFVIFHRKQRKIPVLNVPVVIDNVTIRRVAYTKFLGVQLDENMSWSEHVHYIERKLSKYVPIIYRVRHCLNRQALRSIYNSLIYPNILYCICAWGSCTAVALNPLKRLQRKLIRVICWQPFHADVGPLYRGLNLLSVLGVYYYMCGIFVFKSLDRTEWFSRQEVTYATRASELNLLSVPFVRTVHSSRSIRIRGAHVWNNIPESIKNSVSYNSFKINFKNHLLDMPDFLLNLLQ